MKQYSRQQIKVIEENKDHGTSLIEFDNGVRKLVKSNEIDYGKVDTVVEPKKAEPKVVEVKKVELKDKK